MNMQRHWWKRCSAALVMSAGITLGTGIALAQTAPATANKDGVEVLTRGPIHEAFAEEDLTQLPSRLLLLDQGLEQLRGRDLLHPDEDVSEPVLAPAEGLQLLDEGRLTDARGRTVQAKCDAHRSG